MSLIFDSFPTRQQAEAFASAENGQVFDTEEAAQEADPFPYPLTPPIVHTPRAGLDEERATELAVQEFGGRFVGT
jgi:hypothetical protein